MHSDAQSVSAYLKSLPIERRLAIEKVRAVILENLPDGYTEVMNWGMITYEVPLEIYPDTYNKKPLMYAALASQKNYMSVYLMGLYSHPEIEKKFVEARQKSGKKLNMGKCCVRFKKLDDLDLNAVGEVVKAVSMKDHVKNSKAREKKK